MKIENNSLNGITPQKPESTRNVDKTTTSHAVDATSSVGGKDKAELSEKAKLLAKAKSVGDTTPAERQNYVSGIKNQVDSGTYNIQYDQLARRLLKLNP